MNRNDRFVNSLTSLASILSVLSVGAFIDEQRTVAFALAFMALFI